MANEKEADWMKDIPNETVCTYYYYVFVITAIVSGLLIVSHVASVIRNPKMVVPVLFALPFPILAVVNTLFLYIICSRALLK
jgi:F0F1-type ATP synthase membrane subunit c/vacuolar-type H+-ATPase subunit K